MTDTMIVDTAIVYGRTQNSDAVTVTFKNVNPNASDTYVRNMLYSSLMGLSSITKLKLIRRHESDITSV